MKISSWPIIFLPLFLLFSSSSDREFFRGLASRDLPIFGPEFTFSNDLLLGHSQQLGGEVRKASSNLQAMEQLIELVSKNCQGCQVERVMDKSEVLAGRVRYSNGFWFQISLDPGVVEVTAKPSNAEEIFMHLKILQEDLFDNAAKINLFPHSRVGGGHIHIGVKKLFDEDPKLFRNFLVDFYNHAELAMGIWGESVENAPHLWHLSREQRQQFKRVIRHFDQNPQMSTRSLAEFVSSYVYTATTVEGKSPQKYQALNLSRLVNQLDDELMTVELRFFRPEVNADQFYRLIYLLSQRIDFLRGDNLIPIEEIPLKSGTDKVSHYIMYLHEMGLEWKKYLDLISLDYLDDVRKMLGPGKDFVHFLRQKVELAPRDQLGELWKKIEFYEKRGELSGEYRQLLNHIARRSKGTRISSQIIRDLIPAWDCSTLLYWMLF